MRRASKAVPEAQREDAQALAPPYPPTPVGTPWGLPTPPSEAWDLHLVITTWLGV